MAAEGRLHRQARLREPIGPRLLRAVKRHLHRWKPQADTGTVAVVGGGGERGGGEGTGDGNRGQGRGGLKRLTGVGIAFFLAQEPKNECKGSVASGTR